MIEVYMEQFAGIEVLHAVPAGAKTATLDTVLFYHGFKSSKTVYSYFAVALAQAGFRVVMPDAPDHGGRFSGNDAARDRRFWQILEGNMREFPSLLTALRNAGLVETGRLYVGGASMGGMTALGLMTAHYEIAAAACLMGSGYYSTLARALYPPNALQTVHDEQEFTQILAPLRRYEAGGMLSMLADRPLFLWHGQDDDVVPAVESFRLEQALHDAGLDHNLSTQWENGVKHRITPAALEGCVAFFRRVAGCDAESNSVCFPEY